MKLAFIAAACIFASCCAYAQSANVALDEARAALLRGDTLTAEKILSAIDGSVEDRNDLEFLRGTLAVQKKEYDIGIALFRGMLAREPTLNRVRLDLAQAYFLKGDDAAAEYHFRAALAQGLPPEVEQNVLAFLDQIRRRKVWDASLAIALAPDTNINAATTEDSVSLFGLPFVLDPTAQRKSGLGLSVAAAGEYRWATTDQFNIRIGGAYYETQYTDNNFNDRAVAGYVGPMFIASGGTKFSVLATGARRWFGGDAFTSSAGLRFETETTLSPRWMLSGSASWENRTYDAPQYAEYSGPVYKAYGTLTYAIDASSLLQNTVGVVREQASLEAFRSWQYITSLNYYRENIWNRFALGIGIQAARINYDAALIAFGKTRADTQVDYRISLSNAGIDFWGFTPVLSYIHSDRYSNINLFTFHRDRGEIGLRRNF